jgi:2-amino-4-hydroxy-6-hydroxymethyldihydropteridine diphosphokinase
LQIYETQKCAIALGSNLGDSQGILTTAMQVLATTPGIAVQAISSWYRTKPISGIPQPDYLNGCALLQVQLPPQQLLQTLLTTEAKFGRVRGERWGARSIDLDLLLYEDFILDTPQLQLPHPRMNERAFVLVPLTEIAPNLLEPISGKMIWQLLQGLDCSGVIKV